MPSSSDTTKAEQVERAVASLLEALGQPLTGELEGTPKRVTELWLEHLLAGHEVDLDSLTMSTSPSQSVDPVSLVDIGVHMVCPHHLTIAFGKAHVAYVPGGKLTGFGGIAKLVNACTQRLILQEDAATLAAQTLVKKIDAQAAVVVLDATHPCHNVLHPRSHQARAVSWARAGNPEQSARLESILQESTDVES